MCLVCALIGLTSFIVWRDSMKQRWSKYARKKSGRLRQKANDGWMDGMSEWVSGRPERWVKKELIRSLCLLLFSGCRSLRSSPSSSKIFYWPEGSHRIPMRTKTWFAQILSEFGMTVDQCRQQALPTQTAHDCCSFSSSSADGDGGEGGGGGRHVSGLTAPTTPTAHDCSSSSAPVPVLSASTSSRADDSSTLPTSTSSSSSSSSPSSLSELTTPVASPFSSPPSSSASVPAHPIDVTSSLWDELPIGLTSEWFEIVTDAGHSFSSFSSLLSSPFLPPALSSSALSSSSSSSAAVSLAHSVDLPSLLFDQAPIGLTSDSD